MQYKKLVEQIHQVDAQLIAVSKTKSEAEIMALYEQGQRDFGENRVQEVVEKYQNLPKDIRWHFIGHLQRNKVKDIASFIHLIHAIDSPRLLKEVNKQAKKVGRQVSCLLQFHIAEEDSKYGFDWAEVQKMLAALTEEDHTHLQICGVMGMATYTDNKTQVQQEFQRLSDFFVQLKEDYFSTQDHFKEISMGMSGDYLIALERGSTLVRIGSLLFGARN